jgi:hypothetical protein
MGAAGFAATAGFVVTALRGATTGSVVLLVAVDFGGKDFSAGTWAFAGTGAGAGLTGSSWERTVVSSTSSGRGVSRVTGWGAARTGASSVAGRVGEDFSGSFSGTTGGSPSNVGSTRNAGRLWALAAKARHPRTPPRNSERKRMLVDDPAKRPPERFFSR